MSALLADEQRLALPGTAAELAQHCLASHDIPGAFAASIRAGEEAERLGAPAEAHRHYDQALALWERVTEPEQTAGMHRGKLGLLSATNAADSGDVDRAVHLLRRLRHVLATQADQGRSRRARQPGQQDRRAPGLLPVDDRRRQDHGRGRRYRPGHRGPDARAAADLALRPGGGHLRQHPAGRRRLRPGPRAGRARARRGPRGRGPLGAGRRAGHPGVPQQSRRPQRRGHQAADRGAQAGPRGQGARGGAARGVPPGPGAPGARRPGGRRDRGVRGHQAGQPDRARPRALRHRRAAPALPVPLRRRQVGPCPGDRGRLPGPRHQHPEASLSSMALFIDVARGNPVVAERRAWIERFL